MVSAVLAAEESDIQEEFDSLNEALEEIKTVASVMTHLGI